MTHFQLPQNGWVPLTQVPVEMFFLRYVWILEVHIIGKGCSFYIVLKKQIFSDICGCSRPEKLGVLVLFTGSERG